MRVLAASFVVMALAATSAMGVTITYCLNDNGDGTFEVYGCTSDDNGGIAVYGFVLNGTETSIQHVSPYGKLGPVALFGAFSILRTADVPPGASSTVFASQDFTNAAALPAGMEYGYGQVAGDATASISWWGATPQFPVYGVPGACDPCCGNAVPALIATGTYDGPFCTIDFDYAAVDNTGACFESAGSLVAVAADIVLCKIPEPATMTLLGAGVLGLLIRKRR